MINYYDILGCRRDATDEELKKCYRDGAKKFHPDKTDAKNTSEFLLLQKAWTTLSDAAKRKEYDKELDRREWTDSPMYCELELSEMDRDGECFTYNCRCGGVYRMGTEEVQGVEEVRVGCDDCTFHIRIKVTGTEGGG